jgi:hypothetical protein
MLRLALVVLVALAACATPRGTSPVRTDDAPAPRADLYVFNVSRGSLIPLRRHVTIDGYPLVSLWRETRRKLVITPGPHELVLDTQRLAIDTANGGTYFVVIGYRPRRTWLMPLGAHPIFIRRITEAEALRLFTEMKPGS